ncbi:DUF7507 domain-containing protein [Actinomadura oligospora]|uniref:DUF7507 domain-containing protein n=1 Tax=Actinomadura oligospora TaxID=111804 RepID=UPI003CCBA9FB
MIHRSMGAMGVRGFSRRSGCARTPITVRARRCLSEVRCPRTSLWPGQSMICTATYRVTREDLWKRSVKNCAVAYGRTLNTGDTRRPDARARGPTDTSP